MANHVVEIDHRLADEVFQEALRMLLPLITPPPPVMTDGASATAAPRQNRGIHRVILVLSSSQPQQQFTNMGLCLRERGRASWIASVMTLILM